MIYESITKSMKRFENQIHSKQIVNSIPFLYLVKFIYHFGSTPWRDEQKLSSFTLIFFGRQMFYYPISLQTKKEESYNRWRELQPKLGYWTVYLVQRLFQSLLQVKKKKKIKKKKILSIKCILIQIRHK